MPDILLSAASRRNILELQLIDRLIGKSQNRIATGRRVNTALDGPSSYFTASALRGRADAIDRVVDDTGVKLQTLQAAEAALDAITGLVENAQSLLNAALASPEPQPTATGDIIVSNADEVSDLAGISNGDEFTIQVGSASAETIEIENNDSPTDLLNKLNSVANVSASYTTEGYLEIKTTNGEDLILTDVNNTPLAGLGIAEGTYDKTSVPNAFRASQAAEFDLIRSQIDQLAGDATYNGVNLLFGDSLSFLFNEDGSSNLTINGVTYNSAGLGISAAANEFQLDSNINAAKVELAAAKDTLESYSTRLSTDVAITQIRNEFNSSFTNRLRAGADDLTNADLNEEGANLLALQTRRDLATAALSLLQQSERNVLRMFD